MENSASRRRGGQPGNQNARKHGFYSRSLTQSEACDYHRFINDNHFDREIGLLKVKLKSLMENSPHNRRAISQLVNSLVDLSAVKYDLFGTEMYQVKKSIRNLLIHQAEEKNKKTCFLQNE